MMKWQVGITTSKERYATPILRDTLNSLRMGGFDDLILFVDDPPTTGLNIYPGVTEIHRTGRLKTFGNWMLSLWELWIRNPKADWFAIFQDDILVVKNLREYLEKVRVPKEVTRYKSKIDPTTDHPGFLNLYLASVNEKYVQVEKASGNNNLYVGRIGWHLSDQLGRGALAYVFHSSVIEYVLSSFSLAHKIKDPSLGWRSVDGGISQAFRNMKGLEYVHNPSLVQHTGMESTMGNAKNVIAPTFPGVDVDALDFLGRIPTKNG